MKAIKQSSLKLAGAVALALTITTGIARAGYPPASELAARWWQWVMSSPVATSPLFDNTGEFAAIGQSGPVWFLAGNFGGTMHRTFSVPAGKALFFPIANQSYMANTPGFWGSTPPKPIEVARQLCHAALMQVTQMACHVDGVTVPITDQLWEQSTVFAVRLDPDNVFGLPAPHLTLPGCVDEGYYVLLPPLSRGQHTIHIFAHNPTTDWTLDVTDHITVE